MPAHPVDLSDIDENGSRKPVLLQEVFLTAARNGGEPVTMFLVNGVMLQGEVAAFDLFCLLLHRDGISQLVYKHAISTVVPARNVRLPMADDEALPEEAPQA